MSRPGQRLERALVRLAGWLVPREQRGDWIREWEGELAAWREAGRGTVGTAMGAIPHAMWLFWEGWTMRMDRLARDLRLGARALLRRPLFAGTVVVTLALGIGAAVAVFSVVDAVLLRPLPFPDPDRVVLLGQANSDGTLGTTSWATGTDWAERGHSFDAMALVRMSTATLTGQGDPEQLAGVGVSWTYFDVLGVHPELGRDFRQEEDRPGAERVVILSHRLWARRFASDPTIIGHAVTLSGTDYTVVGVMPASFEPLVSTHFYRPAQYWTALRYGPETPSACRSCNHLRAVARLAAGVPLERARSEVAGITERLGKEYPADYEHATSVVLTLQDDLTRPVRGALWMLLAAVGFVLLIAGANVAGLMMARASDRRREVSLRAALGAARADLVGPTLAECGLLAALGGGLGLLLARLGTDVMVLFAPTSVAGLEPGGLNLSVTVFALGVTLLAAAVAGFAPVIQSARARPASVLKEGSRGTTGGGVHRARGILVIVEVAVAIVLLVGVGLTSRSFARVLAVDPGFDPDGVVKMQVNALGTAFKDDADVIAFHREVLRQVREVPGVEAAGLSSQVPLGGNFDRVGTRLEGWPNGEGARTLDPERYAIAGDYLETMGISLLVGRTFDERDTPDSPPVALVNRTFAEQYWPDGKAVGGHIRMASETAPWTTIVGIVGDVRHYTLEEPAKLQVYLPQSQFASSYMTLVVRTRGSVDAVVDGVRAAVWAVDPDVPVPQVATYRKLIANATAQRRFVVGLMSVFAGVALVLTLVGIYGLLAYHVSRRTHEIGIRMALGAGRSDVLRLVIGQGMALAGVGVAAGLPGALGLTRFIGGMLYGVEPTDPVTLGSVTALMLGVALIACWLPARRATRVDAPMVLSVE